MCQCSTIEDDFIQETLNTSTEHENVMLTKFPNTNLSVGIIIRSIFSFPLHPSPFKEDYGIDKYC